MIFRILLFLILLTGSLAQAQTLNLPPRPADTPTGTELYNFIKDMPVSQREQVVYEQISQGNVPDFFRTLIPVTITEDINGSNRTAVIHVSADYVAVGSDEDFFRIPMTANMAQWVADLCEASLPTRKIVNEVYTAAEVKIAPSFFSPDQYDITSMEIFFDHNTRIENARQGEELGQLVGGIKKDICITPLVPQRPTPRVAIYGWHQLNGVPIQPLSTVHADYYHDYSHGVRLIQKAMTVDGDDTTVPDVLQDPVLNPLLSDEGAFPANAIRYPAGAPPESQPGLPLSDAFPSTGRELPWIDRFKTHEVVPFQPVAPDGDGHVMLVRDTSGGIDTARLGTGLDGDYFVEAHVYCDFRDNLSADGYDRVGLFLRDNGNGLFTGTSSSGVPGNCYGMAWQSDNGRLYCFRTENGVLTDLLGTPQTYPSSAWRKMRLEAKGETLKFYLDGELILETTDNTFTRGQFGVGYQEVFTTNTNIVGTRVDNFKAGLVEDSPGTPHAWIIQ